MSQQRVHINIIIFSLVGNNNCKVNNKYLPIKGFTQNFFFYFMLYKQSLSVLLDFHVRTHIWTK